LGSYGQPSDAAVSRLLPNESGQPTHNTADNVFRDGDGCQITDLGNPPSTNAVVATVAIAA
jgi:hypothetical protein